MSISANGTCVKDFLDDPLWETFDLFDPTETMQIKTEARLSKFPTDG